MIDENNLIFLTHNFLRTSSNLNLQSSVFLHVIMS